jgi:hypothetical protein
MRFTALLHHVNMELLRSSYYGLKRQGAGVTGMTWQEYGDGPATPSGRSSDGFASAYIRTACRKRSNWRRAISAHCPE